MFISGIIPGIVFILIYLSLAKNISFCRERFLIASIVWALLIVLSTEFLSLFQAVTLTFVLGFWILMTVISAGCVIVNV